MNIKTIKITKQLSNHLITKIL